MQISRAFSIAVIAASVCPCIRAEAIYEIGASSTFSMAEPTITVGRPSTRFKTERGTGLVWFSGSASPDGAHPAKVTVFTAGSASAPPDSLASLVSLSTYVFEIDNSLGLVPIVAPFTFSYSWFVTVGVDDPSSEFADAEAFFHITGIDTEVLTIGGSSVSEYRVNPRAFTGFGGTGTSGVYLISGTVTVPAGTLSIFSVITDASGRAEARAVPEPASLLTFALGGAAICWLRRRSRDKLTNSKLTKDLVGPRFSGN